MKTKEIIITTPKPWLYMRTYTTTFMSYITSLEYCGLWVSVTSTYWQRCQLSLLFLCYQQSHKKTKSVKTWSFCVEARVPWSKHTNRRQMLISYDVARSLMLPNSAQSQRHFISAPVLCSFHINSLSLWPSCCRGANRANGSVSASSGSVDRHLLQDWLLLLVWAKWLLCGQGTNWKKTLKGHWMGFCLDSLRR